MRIVHFTTGAADPLTNFGATSARFLPLAQGDGNFHVSCLHLDLNASITSP